MSKEEGSRGRHSATEEKKKKTLVDVYSSLEKDADLCAEEAEGRSQMALYLISKSNALETEEIAKKVVQLGHIN